MADSKTGAPALDDVKTGREAAAAAKPSPAPKPHGDMLGVAAATVADTASAEAKPGDSPKRQGDPLEHALRGAKG